MQDVVQFLDIVTIIAAFAELILTGWLWLKVDDVQDDIDDMDPEA